MCKAYEEVECVGDSMMLSKNAWKKDKCCWSREVSIDWWMSEKRKNAVVDKFVDHVWNVVIDAVIVDGNGWFCEFVVVCKDEKMNHAMKV